MESAENSDFEQATSKTADNENDSSDSGIQICQKDEGNDGNDFKTEDSNAGEELESAIRTESNNVDETLESTVTVEGTDVDEELQCTSKTEVNNADEKIEPTSKTKDNNADEKIECAIETVDNNAELKLESTTKIEPTKEDIAAISPLREDFARISSPKENVFVSKVSTDVINVSTEEDNPETAIEQNVPRDNINQITVELVQLDEGRSPPEIVVEPKIAERFPSGKFTPQIIRVVTP